MFIEVTNKHNPLLIAKASVIMVGKDEKKGTFIITSEMDAVTVEESYDAVKALLLCESTPKAQKS